MDVDFLMTNNSNIVQIFTDGACKGNPGPGGWGAVLIFGENSRELKGYNSDTTNNIMELTAVIEALKSLTRSCNIIITKINIRMKKKGFD